MSASSDDSSKDEGYRHVRLPSPRGRFRRARDDDSSKEERFRPVGPPRPGDWKPPLSPDRRFRRVRDDDRPKEERFRPVGPPRSRDRRFRRVRDDDRSKEERFRPVRPPPSPKGQFRRAEDDDGNPLTIDIPLQNIGGLAGFLSTERPVRQTTWEWLEEDVELERRYQCEKIDRIDVLSSYKYSTNGEESAVLHYKKSSRGTSEGQFRWIHMQCKARSLQNFEHFVSRLNGIDEDEPTLIARLMQKVRDEHEKVYASCPSLEAVDIRCDGQEPGSPLHETKWVIFSCIPFLSVEPLTGGISTKVEGLHRSQGLFQYYFPTEFAQERDKEQVLQQDSHFESNRGLHVSQLWMLILSSGEVHAIPLSGLLSDLSSSSTTGTVVTTSNESLTSLTGPSVRLKEFSKDPTNRRPTFILMSDPLRRLFFFPLDECKTWFALMEKVVAVCHKEFSDYPEHYRIIRQDGTKVEPSDWQILQSEADGSFISISVQMLTTKAPLALDLPVSASPSEPNYQLDSALSRHDSTSSDHSPPFSDISDIDQNSTDSEPPRNHGVVEGGHSKRQETRSQACQLGSGSKTAENEIQQWRKGICDPLGQSLHASDLVRDRVSAEEWLEPDDELQKKPDCAVVASTNDPAAGECSHEEHPPPTQAPDTGLVHMSAMVEKPLNREQSERSPALIKHERRSTIRLRSSEMKSLKPSKASQSENSDRRGKVDSWGGSGPHMYKPREPGVTSSAVQGLRDEVANFRRRKTRRSRSREVIGERNQSPTIRAYQILGRKNVNQSHDQLQRRSHQALALRQRPVPYKGRSHQALALRQRPVPYEARTDGPPPSRVQRYPVPPSSDLIINEAAPSPVRTANSDAYYLPRASKKRPSSIFKGEKNSRASVEAKSIGAKPGDDSTLRERRPSGNDRDQRASAPSMVKADRPEPFVPPVFLWPVGRPLKAGEMSSREHSDDKRISADANLPSKSLHSGAAAPGNEKEAEQTLKAILESVDMELSSDKDYNTGMLHEDKTTHGKLYQLIQAVSRTEIAAKMIEIAGVRGDSGPSQIQKDAMTWQMRLRELELCCLEIFDFFLPPAHSDKVSGKYFGALMHFLKVISEMCERQNPSLEESPPYFTVDISKIPDLRVNGPTIQPSKPISECEKCNHGEQYQSITATQTHLQQVHFASHPVSTQELLFWIADSKRLREYQLCADAQQLIDQLLNHFIHLRKLKKEISHGVCAKNRFDGSLYRLPSGLVKAFRRILSLMAYVAHVGHVARRKYKNSQDDHLSFTFIDRDQIQYIEILGYEAEGSLDAAKNELLLMGGAGDYSRGIGYDAVGPEYVMFLLRGDLYGRTHALHGINLLHKYQEYATSLKYQAFQRPRKRLLSKIYAFREEVIAVHNVMEQQHVQTSYYGTILRPTSFRITTRMRQLMYEHEWKYWGHLLDNTIAESTRMKALQDRIETLARETTQQVEILQEDHGKAILVFTIVTIIFLPLSFVSSLLGMNTADVRNSSANQWLFWAIAVPLTTIVVAASVLIGYRSEEVRQFWEKTIQKLGSRKTVRAPLSDQRDDRYKPDEESIV